ncbi:MAG: NapC/NirT family cytochrome c [Candidatus Omnitrophica bacterium]|nr:NapC/NirT family cytochrome c [Candidatus Omnitrophota bacterium]
MKNRFAKYFYNNITYIGVFLALFILGVEFILFAIDFLSGSSNIYIGIITYAVLPIFLILGLILIPVGAIRRWRKILKGADTSEAKLFYIDTSIATHRNALFIFVIGTVILIIMTAMGSYKVYEYTESVQFCGITCHGVMKPEYTAYLNSAHARVKCIECHVGEGPDNYIQAKAAGLRQVFHLIKGDYQRPISTPVHNLRPADETCEHCHSPDKFYNSFEIKRTYFPTYSQEQPEWLMRMLVHVGSSNDFTEGIHAHMYLDNDIYFVADDERYQKISWVKSVSNEGKETVFFSADSKWKDSPPPPEMIHKMDCIDCHNRPTHNFNEPNTLVNLALQKGEIDPTLPLIKQKAMEALSKEYSTEEAAMEEIPKFINEFYKGQFSDSYKAYQDRLDQASKVISEIFKKNIFPEMKARWDEFPDNIGHMVSDGCFRCHDGEHQTDSGKVITKDCSVCHTIIEQGHPDNLEMNTKGVAFIHPFEDDGLWQEMKCSECHTGN